MKKLASNSALILAALIWGFAFVAQSVGMKYVEPYTFTSVRFFIGGTVLLPLILIMSKHRTGKAKDIPTLQNRKAARKTLFFGGMLCGCALCVATVVQQIGIMYTSVGNAGFITAMYILIVPVLGLFFRRKVSLNVWISVTIAVFGLYLLSLSGKLSVNKGDIYMIACAFLFAIQIMLVSYFSPKVDCVKLSCIQFYTVSLLSAVPMLIYEHPDFQSLLNAQLPLLYTGVLSSGVAYTLQIIGQKNSNETVASLLMSLESVFSMLAGMIILSTFPTVRESIGAVLMFIAIILAQLPGRKKPSRY